MKKLFFKAAVMVIIAIGMSNYLMYLTTGKSPFSDVSIPSFSTDDLNIIPSGPQQAYKWTDANGVTHYSSEPPNEQTEQAQMITVDPNANLIQGVPNEKEEPHAVTPSSAALPKGNIYNPKTIKKLIDDAKNVQKLLDDRAAEQEEILNGN